MTDEKKSRGPADASRVNVNEDYEVEYWCEKFDCTPTELRLAVRAVGVMARSVGTYLSKRKPRRK